jgi:uncharacterized membrane protein
MATTFAPHGQLPFVSLGALIFLDHLAHSIQIDRLMVGIERATIQVISEEPPGLCPGSGLGEAPGPLVWAVAIRARRHGYVQTIHTERLLPLAEQLGVSVQIVPLVGEHVVLGRPIAYAWRTSLEQQPPDPSALAAAVQDSVRPALGRAQGRLSPSGPVCRCARDVRIGWLVG